MFAIIDLAYIALTAFICLRYHANFVAAWQHLVAWLHGAQSYASYLEGKAARLVTKADAIKSAATSAAAAITTAAKS